MPLLVRLLVGLIVYIASLPGAGEGFKTYLIPEVEQFTDPDIYIAAMGQAFFSLSIGLGGMMIYGSYLRPGAQLGRLSLSVAALDTLVAFLAGLLIIPALFVAIKLGVSVEQGNQFIGEGQLIFAVLPELFGSMGFAGLWVGFGFFILLSIATPSTMAQAGCRLIY